MRPSIWDLRELKSSESASRADGGGARRRSRPPCGLGRPGSRRGSTPGPAPRDAGVERTPCRRRNAQIPPPARGEAARQVVGTRAAGARIPAGARVQRRAETKHGNGARARGGRGDHGAGRTRRDRWGVRPARARRAPGSRYWPITPPSLRNGSHGPRDASRGALARGRRAAGCAPGGMSTARPRGRPGIPGLPGGDPTATKMKNAQLRAFRGGLYPAARPNESQRGGRAIRGKRRRGGGRRNSQEIKGSDTHVRRGSRPPRTSRRACWRSAGRALEEWWTLRASDVLEQDDEWPAGGAEGATRTPLAHARPS